MPAPLAQATVIALRNANGDRTDVVLRTWKEGWADATRTSYVSQPLTKFGVRLTVLLIACDTNHRRPVGTTLCLSKPCNTGIPTYVWVLSNRKPKNRKCKAQLIDHLCCATFPS